jgi:type VI protein secretion system component VasK
MFGGFGGGFGGFGGGFGGYDFPWLLNGQQNVLNGVNANTTAGFNQAAITSQLGDINSAITTGFSNAEVANCNRAMDSMQTAYNNQIASMNQNFANQQALDSRLYAMQSQQAECCCENRLQIANLSSDIAREACATRTNDTQNTQAILNAVNGGVQSIKDMMCQDKIDAKNEKIAELQQQVNMQNLAASQAAQTAKLIADNTAQTQYVVNRIAPYPIPAYQVANPYGCNGYNYVNGFAG